MSLSSTRQLHDGMLTAGKGLEFVAFSFRVNGTSDPNGIVQAGANVVDSIAYAGGEFTVQLTKNYARQIVAIIPKLASADRTVLEDIVYKSGSYSATAGTFVLAGVTDDGDGTGTVEALQDNGVVSVIMVIQTMNILVEDEAS